MKEKAKSVFREHLNNQAFLKQLKEDRMMIIGLSLGFLSTGIIKNDLLGIIPTALIATTLLFLAAFIDFKLSK